MAAKDWTMLFLLSVLWGGSFFFFKILVAELPPLTVALARVGVASIALNLLLAVRQVPLPFSLRTCQTFILMGLLNNAVPFALIAFGETQIASGLAAVLNAITPNLHRDLGASDCAA